jgi:hypothetical protein
MRPVSTLAILRRASWRRFGAALALAALLVQGLGVALHMHAHAASWDDAAAICHAGTGDEAAATPTGDDSDHSAPSCPLCLALQHLGKLLPPADAAILLPPAAAPLAFAPSNDAPIDARFHRPQLPRGPPISG